jgi:hypothetical protein
MCVPFCVYTVAASKPFHAMTTSLEYSICINHKVTLSRVLFLGLGFVTTKINSTPLLTADIYLDGKFMSKEKN